MRQQLSHKNVRWSFCASATGGGHVAPLLYPSAAPLPKLVTSLTCAASQTSEEGAKRRLLCSPPCSAGGQPAGVTPGLVPSSMGHKT